MTIRDHLNDKRRLFILLFSFCLSANVALAQDQPDTSQVIEAPIIAPKTISTDELGLVISDGKLHLTADAESGQLDVNINGDDQVLTMLNGRASTNLSFDEAGSLVFLRFQNTKAKETLRLYHISKSDTEHRIRHIPLWLSIVPPLLAIILALILKEVVISLFAGIWAGAFIAGGIRLSSIYYFAKSIFDVLTKYIISALNDSGHISIIVFSLLIGGMVAIISKNGGMAGVVKALSKYARSPRSTQFITWLLGVAIFFDDYANTLIVGNTMRGISDKFRISREKLAYIVDSTAAPVSAVAFITTWIGAELGYIDDGIKSLNLDIELTPYSVFISSLKYSFYPVLTLIFILILIYFKKDYGPMHKAEVRARTTGQVSPARTEGEDEPDMEDLSPVNGAPLRWYNAVIPVLTVIFMTIFGLLDTGMQSAQGRLLEAGTKVSADWGDIWPQMGNLLAPGQDGFVAKLGLLIGMSDSYVALLWASLSGLVMAIILTLAGRIMKLFDTIHWMSTGFKTMMPALIILTLAWALAHTTADLHTADFLSGMLRDSINPYLFPVLIFVLSAVIAFSTGSSWSTMAILYPIAIPTVFAICQANNMPMDITMELMFNVIATVLAASVVGDHCSPISDTTILSSLASDCNHIDHVRTQLPYALTVGTMSLICVGLSTFLGGGILISLILVVISVAILFTIVKVFGKSTEVGQG